MMHNHSMFDPPQPSIHGLIYRITVKTYHQH